MNVFSHDLTLRNLCKLTLAEHLEKPQIQTNLFGFEVDIQVILLCVHSYALFDKYYLLVSFRYKNVTTYAKKNNTKGDKLLKKSHFW